MTLAFASLWEMGETLILHFEVKSIHAWMAAGEKLTDLSGGSEILEELVSEKETGLLGNALAACDIEPSANDLNAASQFKLLVADADKAQAFSELWPLLRFDRVQHLAWHFQYKGQDMKGTETCISH